VSKRITLSRPIALVAGSLAAAALISLAVPRAATQIVAPTPRLPGLGDLGPRGAIKTIVIDPGHGGDDDGVHGLNGAKEKDVVFKIAQQLKTEIETRMQLTVLLTRETDDNIPVDQRAVFANTHKADLFLSLHANASVRQELRGTEVVTLNPDDYTEKPAPPPPGSARGKTPPAPPPPPQIPVFGGGMRTLEPVPWELAQLPFVERSAMLSATLVKHLTTRQIPANTPLATTAPVRVLVGANMPAALIELGFLTNADDEAALTGTDIPALIIAAILDTIESVRYGFPTPPGVPRNQ
jgi:N-acetylmuramoyl-L-alanine amidase